MTFSTHRLKQGIVLALPETFEHLPVGDILVERVNRFELVPTFPRTPCLVQVSDFLLAAAISLCDDCGYKLRPVLIEHLYARSVCVLELLDG